MIKLKRALPITIISLLVITIALTASSFLRPNQQTPIKQLLPTPKPETALPSEVVVAAWIWKYPTQLAREIDTLLEFSQNQGINTIYIPVDEYIDIYEQPESAAKASHLAEYELSLKNILSQAKSRGIVVHALAGNPSYGFDSHEYIPLILLKHVYEFNQTYPDTQFAGIQFDIEFYDDPRFFGDTAGYTQNFLKLVNTLASETARLNLEFDQQLRLGFAIPFWFDKPNDYFEQPILPEVINALTPLADPYLVIMAYRNQLAEVLDITATELGAANSTPVKIIIAQELVENKDTRITLFGSSRQEINTLVTELVHSSITNLSFEGVSLHDLYAYMNSR